MSSSSSSDSTTVEEATFIGSVMAKTVAYYQNRLGETSCARSNLRKPSLRRNHEAEHDLLIEDYFVDDAIHAVKFQRRFRMRKELFLRIVGDLEGHFPYFQWKMDAMRKKGKHGFPGMLGSIDCMHWSWSLCPNAWRGQYMRGDHKESAIILEAIASHDLWIWHAFFGPACANNDINVLNQSPVFNDIYLGKSHDVPFKENEVAYKRGYYLTDGIYPPLYVFVKSFTCPNDPKRKKFKEAQESARKDVERTFGVLKRRSQVLTVGARSYEVKRLQHVMYACIILHNMILEDEGRAICRYNENEVLPNVEGVVVDEDSDMFVESEDSNDESNAGENDTDDQGDEEDDEGDDEDDDSV
ncbi:hypothetical protein Lser_V15G39712 [Lactuca serriola]